MRSCVAFILVGLGIIISVSYGSDAQWELTDWSKFAHTSIVCFAVRGTNLFAGTENGIFLSTNNGKSWNAVNSGLPKKIVIKDLLVSGTNLFAGTEKGVFLSTNNGKKWKRISSGLTDRDVICLAVIGPNLFAGTHHDGVFLSINNGRRWEAVNSGLPENSLGITYCVNNIVTSGTNLFVSTGDPLDSRGNIYMSSDYGKKWITLSPGLWDLFAVDNIIDIGLIPIIMDLNVTGPNLFIGSDIGVLLSTDNGNNWTKVNSGLPLERDFWKSKLDVYSLEAIGENLFAGTEKGVYMSTNECKSWTAINAGLPENTSVLCFAVSAEYLFVGTSEAGAWRLPLSDLSIEKR